MYDELRSNPICKFKSEIVNDKEVIIVAYMISDSNYWKLPNALETRGNTYDAITGRCICAMFPKFFNLGENLNTTIDIVKPKYSYCTIKIDGSMVAPCLINNKVIFKTKKSFYSNVANQINNNIPDNILNLSLELLSNNLTPIFEYTSQDTKIVIDYGVIPKFTLLEIRSMSTGESVSYDKLKELGNLYNVNILDRVDKTFDEIIDDIDNLKDSIDPSAFLP